MPELRKNGIQKVSRRKNRKRKPRCLKRIENKFGGQDLNNVKVHLIAINNSN
jgi:hypothetical protein